MARSARGNTVMQIPRGFCYRGSGGGEGSHFIPAFISHPLAMLVEGEVDTGSSGEVPSSDISCHHAVYSIILCA